MVDLKRSLVLENRCADCPLVAPGSPFEELVLKDECEIGERSVLKHFDSGELIVEQEQPTSGWFILRRGNVKVHITDQAGREHIVRIAGPGDILGTCGLKDNTVYCYSAVALQDNVEVCFIPFDRGCDLIGERPAFARFLIDYLSSELSSSYKKQHSLATRTAQSRIAHLLLEISCDKKSKLEKIPGSQVTLSRQDIAEMIGVSTETAVRALTSLKKQGLVATAGRRIVLLEEEKLRELAENR